MRVGILGAGAVGSGTAALLISAGHEATLWSPSGNRTRPLVRGEPLRVEGALEGEFRPRVAANAQEVVAGQDALLLAAPGYAHRALFDAIVPLIEPGQIIILGAHHSFGALYLSRKLADRGIVVPIVVWGTTVTTGQQRAPGSVIVSTIRAQIDVATVPASLAELGLKACIDLFGERFVERRGGLLAVALSNLNPQNHMALALTNLTRIERAETWEQFYYYTPTVGSLVEALDQERLAIAEACGCTVRSVIEHLRLSYHVEDDTASNMILAAHAKGAGGYGPKSLETRYITEDCPFGLVMTAMLGRKVGRPAHLHEAGISILSALYRREFRSENNLLDAVGIDGMSIDEIRAHSEQGYVPHAAARKAELAQST